MDNKKCSICGKPYKILELNVMKLQVADCECELEEYDKAAKNDKIRKLIEKCNIPKKYINDNLEDWVEVGDNKQLMEISRSYMSNSIKNIDDGKSILFAGSVGTGKTRMQCFLLKRLISDLAVDGLFVSYDDFSNALSFDSKSANIKPFISKLRSVDILMLDDFGECPIVKTNLNHLTNLINHRYYNSKTTLFTTMQTIEKLNDIVGEHIVSRVLEMCGDNIVELVNTPDLRKPSNRNKYLNKS